MNAPIRTEWMCALLIAGAAGTSAGCGVTVEDQTQQGRGGGGAAVTGADDMTGFDQTCLPCAGAACGYCPIYIDLVTFRCDTTDPPVPMHCYATGSVFDEDGVPYVCVLCA